MTWVAVAVGVGGAVIGAVGSNMAANTQANAAESAANTQRGMFNTIVGNEAPFVSAGQGALSPLMYGLGIGTKTPATGTPSGVGYGSLTAPFTEDTFKTMSPAYKFALQQGGQGVLNQDATSGSALAAPALKDLISFNSQFANQSFNNAFNQYQTQQNNIYSRLAGLAGMGQAAGTNQAVGGSSFGQSIGQQVANVGTAQAGGIVGATNSLTGALPWLYANNSGSFGGGPSSSDILAGNNTNIPSGP